MSRLKTISYFIRMTHKISPRYILTSICASLFLAVTPLWSIIIVRYIIDELTDTQDQQRLFTMLGLLVIGNFVLRIINRFFAYKLEIERLHIMNEFDSYIGQKCVEIDFQHIEDTEILDLKERAVFAIHHLGAVERFLQDMAKIVNGLILITGLVYLLFILSPWLILGIIAIVSINALIFRHVQKLEYKVNQTAISGNRAYAYYLNLTTDFTIAKDIRLFNGSKMIVSKIKHFTDTLLRNYSPVYTALGKFTGITKVNIQLQMSLIYVYLAYSVLNTSISIGEFTMYAGAINTLSITLASMIEAFIQIDVNCNHLDLFIKFDQLEPTIAGGDKKVTSTDDLSIVFHHVHFSYPGKDTEVLSDINITIKKGERLSIVGLNGAGKTTFIKLLARLYQPTKGIITIGGIDVNELQYHEYMELLSIVFQDFKLLSYSIEDNLRRLDALVSDSDNIDIHQCLHDAGFKEDLDKLEQGIDTCIYKNFDKSGIEFSGGQAQKIAIARALYKDSPIVILDEPTSALDPISEFEVYNSFDKLVQEKTAIYISHRLSSTRFSDTIAVFLDGKIAEYGSHSDLISHNGLYAEMYTTQSQYYID